MRAGLFTAFITSEKSGGILLVVCSVLSMILANSAISETYQGFWQTEILHHPVQFWVNEVLMTIFFLLVGLEIERELYAGELADLKRASLPIFAAVGGMAVPGLIHYAFNHGLPSAGGFGIPMATDIAFTLAVLSLLGKRIPLALKVFLTALAIIDDLGAIIVIAIFYTSGFSLSALGIALLVFGVMLILNRCKVHITSLYLALGCVMWHFLHEAGVHPTITGVCVAFAIPFGAGDEKSSSIRLQHRLHVPVAFIILPLFALANTAIPITVAGLSELGSPNGLGIMLGLIVGKPAGILLASLLGIGLGISVVPEGLKKIHLFWGACLAGIGFTISIFVTLLAFNDTETVNSSKVAIIVASIVSAAVGYAGLRGTLKKQEN